MGQSGSARSYLPLSDWPAGLPLYTSPPRSPRNPGALSPSCAARPATLGDPNDHECELSRKRSKSTRTSSTRPEDPDDYECKPSRKRSKSTRTPSTRVPVTSPRSEKGWAITKGMAVPKNVAVRKASASHAQHHTATLDSATPVVVIINDAPEQAQFVASSSCLTGNAAPSARATSASSPPHALHPVDAAVLLRCLRVTLACCAALGLLRCGLAGGL